jgi:hypothetical protein
VRREKCCRGIFGKERVEKASSLGNPTLDIPFEDRAYKGRHADGPTPLVDLIIYYLIMHHKVACNTLWSGSAALGEIFHE